MTLTFKAHDGSEHDFDALPAASRQGIVNRGIAHVFGNEVASQVVGHIRQQIADAETARLKAEGSDKVLKASDVTTEQVKAHREANGESVTAKHREFQDAKLKAILEGELGVRAAGGGSSVDPLEKEMLRIAKDEIRTILTKKGWKFPSKGETLKITQAGNPIELDADGWVDRWLHQSNDKMAGGKGEPNEPRIQRLAERNLKAKADAAKRIAQAVEGAEEVDGL